MDAPLYSIPLNDIKGNPINLEVFHGKVLLIVNVASKCGLTPQYEGLEEVYEKFRPRGFEVLGFPANQFMGQEPGSNEEIIEFCKSKFGVKFPMFSKIIVKGEDIHPLYKHLTTTVPTATKNAASDFEQRLEGFGQKREKPEDILWNFEKFLVSRTGEVICRFAPDVKPNDPLVIAAIEKALG